MVGNDPLMELDIDEIIWRATGGGIEVKVIVIIRPPSKMRH